MIKTKEENLRMNRTKNLSIEKKMREENQKFDIRQKTSQSRKGDWRGKPYDLRDTWTKNLSTYIKTRSGKLLILN